MRNRATTRANRVDIDHWQANTEPSDITHIGNLSFAIADQADIRTGAAHIESYDIFDA